MEQQINPDSNKLLDEVCNVLDMWHDWSLMYPMSMTSEDFVDAMSRRFLKFKKELRDEYES